MFSQHYPQLQSNMLIRSAKKRQEEEARTKRTNRMLIGMVSSDWWIAWTSGHVTAVLILIGCRSSSSAPAGSPST